MAKLTVDFSKSYGSIKPMHAINNGPINYVSFAKPDPDRFRPWCELGIPYSRNHDASLSSIYGGDHTVDVHAIFPNFDADVNDPASYDFPVTDNYMTTLVNCGIKPFYRLGTSIEHWVKKYHIYPPKDYLKWAQICEHIIRHYTEGWADGFHYDMVYWEIWNEPDLDPEEATNRRTWGGTAQQFYDFYIVAANHLKSCFPHLKIGGPASAYREKWIEGFFKAITADGKQTPLDFFSWHCYGVQPEKMYQRSEFVRGILDEYGYTETENILNEWNYIRAWNVMPYNCTQIIGQKGAAFTAACMCGCQNNTTIDMLMYYDARPGGYNGLFDFYTKAPLKGNYSFKMFNALYRLGNACKCDCDDGNIYAAAAKNEIDSAVMISYYTDDDDYREVRSITLDLSDGADKYELYLLDAEHDLEMVAQVCAGSEIQMLPNTVCLLKSTASI